MTEIVNETTMSRGQKITNLFGVTLPFVAFLASIFFFWGSYVTWRDLIIFAVGYSLTTLGISIGFHRLFTHRSYETYRPIRYTLAVLGSMAVQGPVIRWVSDHRKHHNFADREGDPHSPHAGFGPGIKGKLAGLWHAHVGWLFRNVGRAEWTKYAKDLLADRGMVFISRWFPVWVGVSLVLPFIAGWIWGGTFGAGLQAMFWGGLIRDLPAPPHHVVGQLGLPLRRLAPLPGQGRVAQRLVALLDLVRRVLAPQPSRVPVVGVPRAQALGARHRRPRDPRPAPARARVEGEHDPGRSPAQARADRRLACGRPPASAAGAALLGLAYVLVSRGDLTLDTGLGRRVRPARPAQLDDRSAAGGRLRRRRRAVPRTHAARARREAAGVGAHRRHGARRPLHPRRPVLAPAPSRPSASSGRRRSTSGSSAGPSPTSPSSSGSPRSRTAPS